MDRQVIDSPEYWSPKELCRTCPITDCARPCKRYTKLAIQIFEAGSICRIAKRKVTSAEANIIGRGTHSEPIYEYNGEYHNLPEWARIVGIKTETLRARIRAGWSFKRCLEVPKGKPRRTFNKKQEAK